MKRFYKLVSCEKQQEGYTILLDGKAIKTKSGALMLAQNEGIAHEIMREWADQGEEINPEVMPFTQILSTKIDQVLRKRDAMSAAVLNYLDTDLICYPAERPEELATLQEQHWGKWRGWIKERFGHSLQTTTGLQALKQPAELHTAIKTCVEAMSDEVFTLLQIATPVSGSLALGLALIEGPASAQEIFTACFIEEHYKDEIYLVDEYGKDPLNEHKQQSVLRDLKACENYCGYLT